MISTNTNQQEPEVLKQTYKYIIGRNTSIKNYHFVYKGYNDDTINETLKMF